MTNTDYRSRYKTKFHIKYFYSHKNGNLYEGIPPSTSEGYQDDDDDDEDNMAQVLS